MQQENSCFLHVYQSNPFTLSVSVFTFTAAVLRAKKIKIKLNKDLLRKRKISKHLCALLLRIRVSDIRPGKFTGR